MNISKLKKTGIEYLYLAAATLCFTLAANLFLQPNSIIAGGFTGLAIILNYLLGWSTSNFYLVSNIILITIAFFILGKNFVMKTVFGAVVLFPFFLRVIPVKQLTDDMLINIVVGAVLLGLGTSFLYYSGGSSGGTAILGSIVHKYTKLSFGSAIAIFDVIIMLIVLCTAITNYITVGMKKSQLVYVISESHEEIATAILTDVVRGITVLNGYGAYNKSEKHVLMCVVNMNELKHVKEIIYQKDPNAFIIINNVSSTYGQGFEPLIP
jgi:uncharacterized membrane-anchored protein YitT (DUF2179 family)